MTWTRKIIAGLLFIGSSITAGAQEILSLDEAIAIALEQNFDIIIARNEKSITELNNSIGNAGMLPGIDINAGHSRNQNKTYQQYFDGRIRESPDAKSQSINAGAQLNWTVFDGMDMFVHKERLEELERIGELNLRIQIENTVAEVIGRYYAIVTEEELLDAYLEAVRISAERKTIARYRYEIGSGSELTLLQASVDLNADSAMLVQQELRTLNARSDLNLLLCRDPKENFKTDHRIALPEHLSETELKVAVEKQNPTIMRARSTTSVANQDLKSTRSDYYPRLSVSSGYSYLKSSSEVGILQSNRNRGMTVGLSLNYALFDGFSKKREMSIAKLNLASAQLSEEKLMMEINAQFSMIFREYETNRMLMTFEEENLSLAERNFSIAQEKYRLGAINDIELRETQIKLLDAENRYLLAQYRSKLAETELLRLSGQLSFEAMVE